MKIGSQEHRDAFCGHFTQTYIEYDPKTLPWPVLDAAASASAPAITNHFLISFSCSNPATAELLSRLPRPAAAGAAYCLTVRHEGLTEAGRRIRPHQHTVARNHDQRKDGDEIGQ